METLRIETCAISGGISRAVTRRPPIHLYTMVPRTGSYAYGVGVLDSSIVQGPVSVAPCQTLESRFATFASLYHSRRSTSRQEMPNLKDRSHTGKRGKATYLEGVHIAVVAVDAAAAGAELLGGEALAVQLQALGALAVAAPAPVAVDEFGCAHAQRPQRPRRLLALPGRQNAHSARVDAFSRDTCVARYAPSLRSPLYWRCRLTGGVRGSDHFVPGCVRRGLMHERRRRKRQEQRTAADRNARIVRCQLLQPVLQHLWNRHRGEDQREGKER
jgi:hypothetical protein